MFQYTSGRNYCARGQTKSIKHGKNKPNTHMQFMQISHYNPIFINNESIGLHNHREIQCESHRFHISSGSKLH
jgi:hypothetical protein